MHPLLGRIDNLRETRRGGTFGITLLAGEKTVGKGLGKAKGKKGILQPTQVRNIFNFWRPICWGETRNAQRNYVKEAKDPHMASFIVSNSRT